MLVTGGTGFTGAYVLRELARAGYTNLYALRRKNSPADLMQHLPSSIQWVEGDLADYYSLEDALAEAKIVIHCAGLVSFLPTDRKRLMQVNQTGTANLVNAALYQGVDQFIHLSSVAALGRRRRNEPISEADKWEPNPLNTRYAISKWLAEQEVWRGQAEGLRVAVAYPSLIVGAGRWTEGTGQLFAYANRQPLFYPKGATGIVDVRDVARALRLMLERNQDGDRFLLNGANLSFKDLLTTIATNLGKSAPTYSLPSIGTRILPPLDRIRSWLTGQNRLITRETVRVSAAIFQYDNQHSQQALNLPYTPIEQTIQETAALFVTGEVHPATLLPALS